MADAAVGLQDVGKGEDVFGLLGEQGEVVGGEGVVDLGVVFVDGAGDAGLGGGAAVGQHADEAAAAVFVGFGCEGVWVQQEFSGGFGLV